MYIRYSHAFTLTPLEFLIEPELSLNWTVVGVGAHVLPDLLIFVMFSAVPHNCVSKKSVCSLGSVILSSSGTCSAFFFHLQKTEKGNKRLQESHSLYVVMIDYYEISYRTQTNIYFYD